MIIFNLDGTLANCENRRHFVDERKNLVFNGDKNGIYHNDWKPDWKSFYESCDKDTIIYPTREILWSLDPYRNKIEIWTSRFESVKDKTIEWIIDQVFLGNFITFDQINLKMRPIGDYTPDYELKERWLDEAIRENRTVDFVFDDKPKVVRMWRRRGIFVFNCNQTAEEF